MGIINTSSGTDEDIEELARRRAIPDEVYLLEEVEFYHTLPNPGGLLDQPKILFDCFNICTQLRAELSKVAAAQQKAAGASQLTG